MKKLLTTEQAADVAQTLRNQEKTVVLVGGCFDILHPGHLQFLKNAREQGEVLMVMLESDEAIRKMKGEGRPANPQQARAEKIAEIPFVDYVLLLASPMTHDEYDNLVFTLKPAIIATTAGDPYRMHKERQGRVINAQVVDVIERIPTLSTTKIIKKVSSFEI